MIIFIIILIVVLGLSYYLFPLIQVIGESMYPTYKDTEIVFGTRLFRKSKLKEGEVITYHTPTDGKIVIKRIAYRFYLGGKLYLYCVGDNKDNSYDSRHYGSVPSKNVVCKVVVQRKIQ